jgi:hypothetical protein
MTCAESDMPSSGTAYKRSHASPLFLLHPCLSLESTVQTSHTHATSSWMECLFVSDAGDKSIPPNS